METQRIPWLFALLTAGWFGWMARRAGRTSTLWAVGGAAFGLVISTLVLGLGTAASLPFSDHERTMDEIKGIVVAALLIAAIGWLLTSSLHRHHLILWRTFTSGPPPNDPLSGAKLPPSSSAKPVPGKVPS